MQRCLRALRLPVYPESSPSPVLLESSPALKEAEGGTERNCHAGFEIRHLLACLDSVRRHPGMETDVVFPIAYTKLQPWQSHCDSGRITVLERGKRTPQSDQIKKKESRVRSLFVVTIRQIVLSIQTCCIYRKLDPNLF